MLRQELVHQYISIEQLSLQTIYSITLYHPLTDSLVSLAGHVTRADTARSATQRASRGEPQAARGPFDVMTVRYNASTRLGVPEIICLVIDNDMALMVISNGENGSILLPEEWMLLDTCMHASRKRKKKDSSLLRPLPPCHPHLVPNISMSLNQSVSQSEIT